MRLTFLIPFSVMLLSACSSPVPAGPPRPTARTTITCSGAGTPGFTAAFLPGETRNPVDNLQVTFTSPPTSDQADAALRACIEAMRKTVRVDYETLVTSWVGEEGPLPLPDGSTSMAYDPKTGSVKTWNEREGIVAATAERDGYAVETTEEKMAVPPFTPYLTMNVLFEKKQAEAAVEKILVTEVEAAARKRTPRVDVMAFALVGPATDRNAQQQIRGASGT